MSAEQAPEAHADALLRRLADELVDQGAIRSPHWRAAFERVPRHLFVPRYHQRTASGRVLLDAAEPGQRQAWLDGVYRDAALPIACAADDPTAATSSSTQPSLMARMLEALTVRAGQRVLEIGTGTGYNAALLCERLGSALITTIDVDPALVEAARTRLRAAGYTPTVAVADGAGGFLEHAPYDRLIATCSVASVPPAWIQQTRPGGLILVNLLRGCDGGLARVEVLADGFARGRFLSDSAYFMPMSGQRWARPPLPALRQRVQQQGHQRPVTLPQRIADERFWFLVQLALPGVLRVWLPRVARPDEPDSPQPSFESPCLVDLTDGSWARTETTGGRGSVTQGGPRRLWDEIEALYDQCATFGFPDRDRYGLTLTPDGIQRVWLDDPDSGYNWNLLTTAAAR